MPNSNIGIIACAGAGKTYTICKKALDSSTASLIITYTNKGRTNINDQIRKLNQGVPSNKITVETWFEFLLHEIIKPYQSILLRQLNNYKIESSIFFNSIDFSTTRYINYRPQNDLYCYYSNENKIKHNEAVIFVNKLMEIDHGKVINRLYQQYKTIYFDEVQDLVGTDLDVIEKLIASQIDIVMVGDPKQFTYTTHSEKKNKRISGTNIEFFYKKMCNQYSMELRYSQTTRRFGAELAALANEVDPSGETLSGFPGIIEPEHHGVFLITMEQLPAYLKKFCNYNSVSTLIYDKRTKKKMPRDVPCINFGDSKGLSIDHVVIVPPGPLDKLLQKGIPIKSPAKYYIAVTRARFSIAFVVKKPESYLKSHPTWQVWHTGN